ncbi:hypothetical protein CDAR_247641 [Caerostris darwini]|uniref:Uncharacterized protein n=1 Tax=Caerostris darwini TaxID=1538125 RepID=A0AAV4T6M5_9ARAC|nr:hypothetical protein CDAR_247641 [Caerostris darwini]
MDRSERLKCNLDIQSNDGTMDISQVPLISSSQQMGLSVGFLYHLYVQPNDGTIERFKYHLYLQPTNDVNFGGSQVPSIRTTYRVNYCWASSTAYPYNPVTERRCITNHVYVPTIFKYRLKVQPTEGSMGVLLVPFLLTTHRRNDRFVSNNI